MRIAHGAFDNGHYNYNKTKNLSFDDFFSCFYIYWDNFLLSRKKSAHDTKMKCVGLFAFFFGYTNGHAMIRVIVKESFNFRIVFLIKINSLNYLVQDLGFFYEELVCSNLGREVRIA